MEILDMVKKFGKITLILFIVIFGLRLCNKKKIGRKIKQVEIQLGREQIGTSIFLCGIGTSNPGTNEMFSLFEGIDIAPAKNYIERKCKKGEIIKYKLPEKYGRWGMDSDPKKSYTYYDDLREDYSYGTKFNEDRPFNDWLIIKIHKNCEFKIGILK